MGIYKYLMTQLKHQEADFTAAFPQGYLADAGLSWRLWHVQRGDILFALKLDPWSCGLYRQRRPRGSFEFVAEVEHAQLALALIWDHDLEWI